MIKGLPKEILRFFILVLLQVMVFNNIQFSGFINPYVYILFILLLPFETPDWLLLLTGFFLGLIIDVFMNTMGVNTSATVFMAFLRPYVLKGISPRDGYETGSAPRLSWYGFDWFLKYSLILIFAHHVVLFYLEVFKFAFFFSTLLRVILSVLFSTCFVLISQYIFYRK